jgi:hypothetical protein
MPTPFGVYHDVTNIEFITRYTLRLTFDDKTHQVIDFEPVLAGPIFGPLRDYQLFRQVQVNKDTGTIEWPNGADFNPVVLHDWPKYKDKISAERRHRYAVLP